MTHAIYLKGKPQTEYHPEGERVTGSQRDLSVEDEKERKRERNSLTFLGTRGWIMCLLGQSKNQ